MFFLAIVAVDRAGGVGAASSFDDWTDHVNGRHWPGKSRLVVIPSLACMLRGL
jgi:hypothetical protein